MAYSAVVSLIRVLEYTQNANGHHQIPYVKQQMESLLKSLRWIAANFPGRRDDDALRLEAKIRDAAYKAEDLVESRISQHFSWDEWFMGIWRKPDFRQRLETVRKEIDEIKEEVMRMQQDSNSHRQTQTYSSSPAGPSAPPSSMTMVGFEDELLTLTDRLTDHYQSTLGIIPILGMLGSGKTTLARQLYNDPYIEGHFDVRAWVTVSNDYEPRKVLLDLLRCLKVVTPEMYQDTYDLQQDLYRSLFGRRYLIVMDDLWGTEVWDDMRRLFSDQRMGSRILLTTRESQVADYANSESSQHHHKRFLDNTQSWDLLRAIVFRHRPYHLEHLDQLEGVGKRIATSCKGLPLSIVVIGGLLANVSPRKRTWESFAEIINSTLVEDEQCSRLLSLSYDCLPHHLKPCFLYMGFFPEDCEISVSKLIRLWIAEGFLESESSLEEVGEKYLTDLISRQLVLISTMSNGKIRTCSIHDLMREFCLRKAKEENFFHSTNGTAASESMKDSRRIINCHSRLILGQDIYSSVRSLISVSIHHVSAGANEALHHCKLLRVLHMDKVWLNKFPKQVVLRLVFLRHVLLCCEEAEIHIPKDICNLQNLRALIILQRSNNNIIGVHLPVELWSIQKLRYLKFSKCYLPRSFSNIGSILEKLGTLSKLSSSNCDVNFFEKTPNLNKLGVHVEQYSGFCLGNVGSLPELENLVVAADKGSKVSIPRAFSLPRLKRLTLDGTKLPWKDMWMIGELPNLVELQLKENAFQGPEWEPIQRGFPVLKLLCLDNLDLQYWIADAANAQFPSLECLYIWECGKLKQISPEIGMIETLETIMLDDASPHAVTWAKDIQQSNEDIGNEIFHVYIFNIWSNTYQKRQEAKEAFEKRKEEEKRRKEEKERREKENRSFSGPHPMMDGHRRSTFYERPGHHEHGFGRSSLPGDGIGGRGVHGSFNPSTGPGNIRGFGGSRF